YYPEPHYAINQQVPYVSLLPGPVITYEYVTESNEVSSKRYKFKVLEEYSNSNNVVSFGDLLQIESQEILSSDYFDKVRMKTINITNNLKSLGRIEEVISYNSNNQVLYSMKNNYSSLSGSFDLGQIQQSFYSKKTITAFNVLGTNYYGSVTSEKTKASIIESTVVSENGHTNTTYFEKRDFLTGQIIESRTEDSKGNRFKTEVIPAYTISEYNPSAGYGMGSKVDNITNKNMLTQDAMSKRYIDDGGVWKEIGVGITTWNNNWTYPKHNDA